MFQTWGKVYWPIWLTAVLVTLFIAEIPALLTRRNQHVDNTLTEWVRTTLHIMNGERIIQWNATDLLVFCAYISIFVVWLPLHFWFRKFN
jgi:hypothetical protein